MVTTRETIGPRKLRQFNHADFLDRMGRSERVERAESERQEVEFTLKLIKLARWGDFEGFESEIKQKKKEISGRVIDEDDEDQEREREMMEKADVFVVDEEPRRVVKSQGRAPEISVEQREVVRVSDSSKERAEIIWEAGIIEDWELRAAMPVGAQLRDGVVVTKGVNNFWGQHHGSYKMMERLPGEFRAEEKCGRMVVEYGDEAYVIVDGGNYLRIVFEKEPQSILELKGKGIATVLGNLTMGITTVEDLLWEGMKDGERIKMKPKSKLIIIEDTKPKQSETSLVESNKWFAGPRKIDDWPGGGLQVIQLIR